MSSSPLTIAIGDPRRPRIGLAVKLTFVASALFVAFAVGVKDIKALAQAAPWGEDSYDALFSFAIFFVPTIVGLLALRLPLVRRSEAVPTPRVADVIRASELALGIVLLTVAAGWESVVASAGPLSSSSLLLVIGLGVETCVATVASIALLRSVQGSPELAKRQQAGPDWLDDSATLIGRLTSRLGPADGRIHRSAMAASRVVVAAIRRSPLRAAGLISVAFGLFFGTGAGLEGDPPVLVLLLGAVGGGGMLTFLVGTGIYLGIVRGGPRRARVPRPSVLATLAAATSLPFSVAFRDSLWWLVDSDAASARLIELAELVTVVAAATFLVVLLTRRVFMRQARRSH